MHARTPTHVHIHRYTILSDVQNIISNCLTQCERSFWLNISHKCRGDQRGNLHLYSTRWNEESLMTIQWSWPSRCRHLHVELPDGHHVVPVWWSGLRDEVWQLDLQWFQGMSCQMNIFLCPSFLHSSHFTIVLSWTFSSLVKKGISLHLFLMENGHF